MNYFLVGGAVRDALLGLPVKDRDWVVVGADPRAMEKAGFTAVGRDFPVFLHPQTHEEYALARTERKTAPGYRGFAFHASAEVTLEQDLARRDLTINAMAQDAQGHITDPYGGQRDLQARVLRHVSAAFVEDPVRVLRLARFAARFPDFSVAPETLDLMRDMVNSGELDALVAERVWQEVSRGLMEKQPSRMLAVLRECGALARLAPALDRLFGVPQTAQHHPEVDTGVHVQMVLDQCAAQAAPLPVRFACLCHDLGKGLTPAPMLPRHIGHEGRGLPLIKQLSERWRVPSECKELADLVAREHPHVHQSLSFGPEARLRLLDRCDAWRRPERFEQLLWACECDARGRLGFEQRPYPQRQLFQQDLRALAGLDLASVSAAALAEGKRGPAIGQAVQAARLAALQALPRARAS